MPTLALSIAVNAAIFNYGELQPARGNDQHGLSGIDYQPGCKRGSRNSSKIHWTLLVAHLLLANADQSAENHFERVSRRCYPLFRADAQAA
jgi:hypothetical protein